MPFNTREVRFRIPTLDVVVGDGTQVTQEQPYIEISADVSPYLVKGRQAGMEYVIKLLCDYLDAKNMLRGNRNVFECGMFDAPKKEPFKGRVIRD
jgi:hypothetical protein